MTASYLFSPSITESGEIGTRYSPLSLDRELRPFFVGRLGYMHMYDTFLTSVSPSLNGGFGGSDYDDVGRYTQGFGASLGTGVEFPLTRSLLLTSELSAMRNRMTTYRIDAFASRRSQLLDDGLPVRGRSQIESDADVAPGSETHDVSPHIGSRCRRSSVRSPWLRHLQLSDRLATAVGLRSVRPSEPERPTRMRPYSPPFPRFSDIRSTTIATSRSLSPSARSTARARSACDTMPTQLSPSITSTRRT